MSYTVRSVEVVEGPLAVTSYTVTGDELGGKIIPMFDQVYAWLKESEVEQTGHNVIVYWDRGEQGLLFTEDGVPIDVGVQISTSFESSGPISCTETPAGTAATTVHTGPYSGIPAAHAAARSWCKENGHIIAGPNWEIYGDWRADPEALSTEIFYLLK